MLELVRLLNQLAARYVMVGITKDDVRGEYITVEYKVPTGEVFKKSEITKANPGYSMMTDRLMNSQWCCRGFQHLTNATFLCEVFWREYGEDIPTLIKFFDENPDLKQTLLR